jgi:hypothetical protein
MDDENLYSGNGDEVLEYAKKYIKNDSNFCDTKEEDLFAYKVHYTDPNIKAPDSRLSKAYKNGRLKELFISNFTFNGNSYEKWRVSDGNKYIEFHYYDNGKIEFYEGCLPRNPQVLMDFDAVERELKKIGTHYGDKELTIKCICLNNYLLSSEVYINYKGKDYFILFSNPKFSPYTDFEEGKLYTIQEINPIIKQNEQEFDDFVKYTKRKELNEKKEKSKPFILTYTSVLIVVLILSVFIVYLIKKYRKNQE